MVAATRCVHGFLVSAILAVVQLKSVISYSSCVSLRSSSSTTTRGVGAFCNANHSYHRRWGTEQLPVHSSSSSTFHNKLSSALFASQQHEEESNTVLSNNDNNKSLGLVALFLSYSILFSTSFTPPAAFAYEDYASDTVAVAVKRLNDAIGDKAKSFDALKDVAEIITDGKGVGGSLSYGGVTLERGLIADEDTSIYNPGLTLLTESEKESLVDAVIQNQKSNILQNSWSEENQLGYSFLKQKLDPFHTVELKGYFKILPFYGAAVYLATLFVQQNARQLFTTAYIVGVVAIFAPVIVLVAKGP